MEKKTLKGRKERIEDDRTWKERRMMWKLGQIAGKESSKGKRVIVRYGKIWIEGKWWRWDEERDRLKDWKGVYRKELEEQRETPEAQG